MNSSNSDTIGGGAISEHPGTSDEGRKPSDEQNPIILSPTTTSSTINSSGSSSGGTLSTVDPHAVSKAEAESYYAGLPSRPILIYRTGKKWLPPKGPEAYGYRRELREVFCHPIVSVWTHDLGWRIVDIMDAHQIRFITIDVIRYKIFNVDEEPVFGPVTIRIGVDSGSTTPTAAHHVAQEVLALLKDYGMSDVDVDFHESHHIRLAGPPLMKPVDELDPLASVVIPFTPTIGFPVSSTARPTAQGSMALYLSEGGDSNTLFGLTCRHVIIGPEEPNDDFIHPESGPNNISLLSEPGFSRATADVASEIAACDTSVKHRLKRIEWFKKVEKGDNADSVIQASQHRTETQSLLSKELGKKAELEKFLLHLNSDWQNVGHRILGPVIRSPPIRLGAGEHRLTEDWAIFEIDRTKLGDGFAGNRIDLGTKISAVDFEAKCSPHKPASWSFDYPADRLLALDGIISEHLMRHPDMSDSDDEPCLLVVKRGAATGLTIGRANGVFSISREYVVGNATLSGTSMEWAILNYDKNSPAFSDPGDSGSIITDIRGRIGGMLTGGPTARNTLSTDLTYATPFWWLLERIKENGFPNAHFNVQPHQ
ncbi:hypothetical protein DL93DRAFT_2119448 [Clavulina sp. PMI_390]|nr:hypothetical protein DL93DRAFT_2119448 [Clavulina sp. PMI_390]